MSWFASSPSDWPGHDALPSADEYAAPVALFCNAVSMSLVFVLGTMPGYWNCGVPAVMAELRSVASPDLFWLLMLPACVMPCT